MATIIKVRCNGPDKHVNEVDIEKLIRPTPLLRCIISYDPSAEVAAPPPEDRYVFKCRFCTEGRVVVTREMIEKNRGKD